MQASLATLLLVVASVIIACIVVDYAVEVVQVTLETTNIPQFDKLRDIQNSILNQTDTMFDQYNQTISELPELTPTPVP